MNIHYNTEGEILIPILQLRKLSLGEFRWLAQGHTGKKEIGPQDPDSTASILSLAHPSCISLFCPSSQTSPAAKKQPVLTQSLF